MGTLGKHWKQSKETKRRISVAKTGVPSPFKGRKHSVKTRDIMSETHSGEKNYAWLGENATSMTKHQYLYNHFGKALKCENPKCKYPRKDGKGRIMLKPKLYNWANIRNHKYTRKREDYIQLCVSCHRLFDNGKIKILQSNEE